MSQQQLAPLPTKVQLDESIKMIHEFLNKSSLKGVFTLDESFFLRAALGNLYVALQHLEKYQNTPPQTAQKFTQLPGLPVAPAGPTQNPISRLEQIDP